MNTLEGDHEKNVRERRGEEGKTYVAFLEDRSQRYQAFFPFQLPLQLSSHLARHKVFFGGTIPTTLFHRHNLEGDELKA